MASFLILGNPGSKRVVGFQDALARCGFAPAALLAWRDLLTGHETLGAHLAPEARLRIESPGRDFAVERLLIARGDRGIGDDLPAEAALALDEDPGRIRHLAQWQRGWNSVCRELQSALEAHPETRTIGAPRDLVTLFDKTRCHAACIEHGIRVPPSPGRIGGYDTLRAAMTEHDMPRVFVKPNAGSSASGVLAYETASGGREQMTAALEVRQTADGPALYNNRRIRRYTDHGTIQAVIDCLARDGVHVERWIPKPSFDGHVWDLRVLTIAGRARHRVARLSRTPLTNLHLLNRRESVERLGLAPDVVAAIEATAMQIAALFSDSLHVGIDILVPRNAAPLVLEVNAFGDLLPGLEHDGEAVYEAEIKAFMAGGRS